jgi:hypothetical protein
MLVNFKKRIMNIDLQAEKLVGISIDTNDKKISTIKEGEEVEILSYLFKRNILQHLRRVHNTSCFTLYTYRE